MKKLIWIDVGTHFAQEHTSIYGSNFAFYLFVLKRFLSGKILKRGKFVSYKELKEIIVSRKILRSRSADVFSIFIEANPRIVHKKDFYPQADIVFNLALTDAGHAPVSIAKLYIGNGGELAEGNSLFKQKHKTEVKDYVATFGISTNDFFKQLELYLSEKFENYSVMLRLNCEGVEDEVIYAAYQSFEKKLEMICGSLKDVEDIKGTEAAKKLDLFLLDNELPFTRFTSGIDSWPEAHKSVLSFLNKEPLI